MYFPQTNSTNKFHVFFKIVSICKSARIRTLIELILNKNIYLYKEYINRNITNET